METATDTRDTQAGPYQETFATVRKALTNIMRNIENKTGSTAGLTKALHLQMELSKVLDRESIKEIQVTWIPPDSWRDSE
jgi:hypothetical protein